jgi:hypothetical protein
MEGTTFVQWLQSSREMVSLIAGSRWSGRRGDGKSLEPRLSREPVCLFTVLLMVNVMVGCSGSTSPGAGGPAFASPSPETARKDGTGGPGPCGCADIPDIEARLHEAQALVPLYQAEIKRLQANGPPPPYTKERYDQFQATLQPALEALATAYLMYATFADGETSVFCNVTFDPRATACMKASNMTHESVHKSVCDEIGWSPLSGTWKKQIGLIKVFDNEVAAYQAEISFLQGQLKLARDQCSAGWRGQITRTITTTFTSSSPMGPLRPGVQSVASTVTLNRKSVDTWTFQGGVEPDPQTTRGRWLGTVDNKRSSIEDTAFSLAGRCSGTVIRSHLDIEEPENGNAIGRASMSLFIGGGVAHITVNPDPNDPPGKITAFRTRQGWSDIVQNDCGHRVPSNDNPKPSEARFRQEPLSIEVPVDAAHPDRLNCKIDPQVQPMGAGATTIIACDLSLGAGTPSPH